MLVTQTACIVAIVVYTYNEWALVLCRHNAGEGAYPPVRKAPEGLGSVRNPTA